MGDRVDVAARTLLEALVRQNRWSHTDFTRAYADTAETLGVKQAITTAHAGKWLGGKLRTLPYPTQCRVLERMFGMDVARLFGPPPPSGTNAEPPWLNPDEEVNAAATESARFAMHSEHTNVGPHTLEQFEADLRRIVTTYPNRPVYPQFVELRELRNRAFELLEGRQYPNQTRDLYLVAGLVCGVLSNASFDMGNLPAAETQARTAFLCAELAGHNGLRAWIRGTMALIAYWDDRPRAAVELTVDGARYTPESGTAMVRLLAIEARARGRMNDPATERALARVATARDTVVGHDDPGGMMTFPNAKVMFYSATARLWLGDNDNNRRAEHDAHQAVLAYEADPPERRRLGELNLARLDLAAALMGRDLDGTADHIRTVLDVSVRRPTDSVRRRLRQVASALDQPTYRGTRLAQDLRHEITAFTEQAAVPALPTGEPR